MAPARILARLCPRDRWPDREESRKPFLAPDAGWIGRWQRPLIMGDNCGMGVARG
jgi:hypothetical protein